MADHLFAMDGSPSDQLNQFADIFGAGVVMDTLRRRLANMAVSRLQQEKAQIEAAAKQANSSEVRAFGDIGMLASEAIPALHYHSYAAEFRMKAAREGIHLEGNGYECWDCPDFLKFYRKQHPELVYKEAKRNACIITPATKYTPIKAA